MLRADFKQVDCRHENSNVREAAPIAIFIYVHLKMAFYDCSQATRRFTSLATSAAVCAMLKCYPRRSWPPLPMYLIEAVNSAAFAATFDASNQM